MKLKHLKAGLEYALNYHGIDARLSTPDHALADAIYLQVAHGVACSKRGLDPAMAPYDKAAMEAMSREQQELDEMAETLRPVKTEQDIAALAERLARLEDRLTGPRPADNYGSILTRLDAIEDRAAAEHQENIDRWHELHKRIDGVATIFGDRVAELGDEIGAATDSAKRAHERLGELDPNKAVDALVKAVSEPAFPTGAATTVNQALDAVEPPKRGDRVRLEGAKSTGQTHIKDGWYDVVGRYDARFPGDHDQFQVGSPASIGLYWVYDTDPGLKEVRHAQ